MPEWFADNRDFGRIAKGLRATGMRRADVSAVMGGNWLRFFETSFGAKSGEKPKLNGAAE
jgi:microsomal dipeptidase-like Zn-dependent dipeptidase